MNRVASTLAIVVLLGGCKLVANIDDTKLIPDAGRPDSPAADAPEPDAPIVEQPIDVGTGESGPLIVSNTAFTDEVRAAVTNSVGAGSTRVPVSSIARFAPGDEVLVIQMIGPDAGRYETHRIDMVEPDALLLATALADNFTATAEHRAQVIAVPNYSRVDVPTGATLAAHAWDGSTGGVIFFRSSGPVTIAGAMHADAIGFGGGSASPTRLGGAGGAGGEGGFQRACPVTCTNVLVAGTGDVGLVDGMGNPGELGVPLNDCRGGLGGRGAISGHPGEPALDGDRGQGDGGGQNSGEGGRNITTSYDRPVPGGGGAAGRAGAGGAGGGGGGGGGGPITNTTSTPGGRGGAGEAGGDGGLGGAGGAGGGVVIVHAAAFELSGRVSALAATGAAGANGGNGGLGGRGGFGTTDFGQANCGGKLLYGGRGGAGGGANGGDGGGGGGGGAGGTVVLNVVEMMIAPSAMIGATGAPGQPEGSGGMPGIGGDGNTANGPPGTMGIAGTTGTAGANGLSFIRHAGACTGCEAVGDPATTVIMIGGS